ncbi:ABC transporter ATP-binding protein [Candidatus Uabimicrobium sp. HlEnr_7]|uniref:ABC transporter ATP-binding protein n=1 Tax=Candidatus Uabimicrobium helgolandensis TaxID=3095367 RepID=UPI0035580455
MQQMIAISDLDMYYSSNIQALKNIRLSIANGEFVAIVGPSGCGKSTLVRLIAGLIETDIGSISVAGDSAVVARKRQQQLALVFQEANLLPWRRVVDNVRLPLELASIPIKEQMARSYEALNVVDLEDFAMAYPGQLSGGMKMRVSIARALVTEPNLMLLDEPFSALDEITRQQLNEDLLKFWQQHNWTTVFITHNIAEAIFLSSRVIVMSSRPGEIIADVKIHFDYPRSSQLRSSIEFVRYMQQISSLLRGGTNEK